ncbi:hypothetical protein BWI15_09810 [Kribbella sp. ALI-6-A]|uniref:hypothetical protein n=1 Tax=Kribbella sp. ALI-6-A TaxID=1933817 RepID=UPI00097BAC4C|nr:hypothetical protein [Kribbella sp. ALI-6-A]ONI73716.1 hypothetical protein BWI15_09810 [Kribbella sp. ALI-6-A]
MATDEMRKDLRAAVAARQDLGAEYEPEIIDGFLDKLDARAAARYGQGPLPEPAAPRPPAGKPDNDPGGLALAIVSVVAGIPITAIAANMEGTIAVIICWGGLVGVNLARAVARFTTR